MDQAIVIECICSVATAFESLLTIFAFHLSFKLLFISIRFDDIAMASITTSSCTFGSSNFFFFTLKCIDTYGSMETSIEIVQKSLKTSKIHVHYVLWVSFSWSLYTWSCISTWFSECSHRFYHLDLYECLLQFIFKLINRAQTFLINALIFSSLFFYRVQRKYFVTNHRDLKELT